MELAFIATMIPLSCLRGSIIARKVSTSPFLHSQGHDWSLKGGRRKAWSRGKIGPPPRRLSVDHLYLGAGRPAFRRAGFPNSRPGRARTRSRRASPLCPRRTARRPITRFSPILSGFRDTLLNCPRFRLRPGFPFGEVAESLNKVSL